MICKTRNQIQPNHRTGANAQTAIALLIALSLSGCGSPELELTPEPPIDHSQKLTGEQTKGSSSIQAASFSVKITRDTTFKTSTDPSDSLPPSQKCPLKRGMHFSLRAEPSLVRNHWNVIIKGKPGGCSFEKGFLFSGHATVPEKRNNDYTLPMPSAFITSQWCTCRDIGSSPHIGTDYAKNSAMLSVAVAKGRVSGVYYNGACGWEVEFRDAGGALWLYRHLNFPAVSADQSLQKGQIIGRHSQYPQSGCGLGAHLHIERLSAGSFGDGPRGRTCQFGFRTCNYDPNLPFASLTQQSLALQDTKTEPSPGLSHAPANASLGKNFLSVNCHHNQPQPKELGLSLDEAIGSLPDPLSHMGGLSIAKDVQLQGKLELSNPHAEQKPGETWKQLSWSFDLVLGDKVNSQNLCRENAGESPRACVVRYEVFVEDASGQARRVSSHQMTRNTPLRLTKEARHCLDFAVSTESRYAVRATLENGQHVTLVEEL